MYHDGMVKYETMEINPVTTTLQMGLHRQTPGQAAVKRTVESEQAHVKLHVG